MCAFERLIWLWFITYFYTNGVYITSLVYIWLLILWSERQYMIKLRHSLKSVQGKFYIVRGLALHYTID
jgi:hypothetical protein